MYKLCYMKKKKIGLVSVFAGWTREVADALNIEYTVLSEEIEAWLEKKKQEDFEKQVEGRGQEVQRKNLVNDVLLPSINEIEVTTDVVLLDMQVLIHREVATDIKFDYELCWIKTDLDAIGIDVVGGVASGVERALYTEYTERLAEICDFVCDFTELGYKGGIEWLKKKIMQ